MTLPLATAALLASLGVLVALLAPQAPRLLRHGGLPARPRRVWVTLLVAREIGTAGAATAAAWLALAASGPLPASAARRSSPRCASSASRVCRCTAASATTSSACSTRRTSSAAT